MKHVAATAALALALAVSGCSATAKDPTISGSASPLAPATSGAAVDEFLRTHNLTGLTSQQVVERLDASEKDRVEGPQGSVRATQVVLTDSATKKQVALPLPADTFYLAVAPYERATHDCFFHNTATCQGEIVKQPVHIRLDHGTKTLVDSDVTTFANGFASVWVPRGLRDATLTVTYNGKRAQTSISTGDQDPTCITKPLKLG